MYFSRLVSFVKKKPAAAHYWPSFSFVLFAEKFGGLFALELGAFYAAV